MRFRIASSLLPGVKAYGKWPPSSVRSSPFKEKSNWLAPEYPVVQVRVTVSTEADHVPLLITGPVPGSVMVRTKVLELSYESSLAEGRLGGEAELADR